MKEGYIQPQGITAENGTVIPKGPEGRRADMKQRSSMLQWEKEIYESRE